ncbi:MAG TPA: hypothetical protein VH475_15805 [Tepidisphaeraceae bacterium]|jgi:hypothetical protein
MASTKTTNAAAAATSTLLAKPAELDEFLAKLAARDRQNVDRHLMAADAEAEGDHGTLWRRLARALFTLSPHAVTTIGQQALLFFIADGKYKKQVFAMEDPRDGRLLVYTADVLKEATKQGILTPPAKGDASAGYVVGSDKSQRLLIEPLDAANTPNPHAWYKNMLGWGRKALRITLPVKATAQQIEATEALGALTAKGFTK